MNQDQVQGYVRAIGAALGGYFVAQGKISAGDLNTILGAISVVAVIVWSHFSNKPK